MFNYFEIANQSKSLNEYIEINEINIIRFIDLLIYFLNFFPPNKKEAIPSNHWHEKHSKKSRYH